MNQVIGKLISKTEQVASAESVDKLLRTLAISTAGNMAYRIHTEGKKADGSQIGTYSKGYMVVRTGAYKNKRKNDAGFFTKGKQSVFSIKKREAVRVKESKRPVYNRTNDTKIVFSLTRQMENDFSLKETKEPIKTATGYGVGFKNPKNAQKAEWLEEKHPGTYKLSEGEKESIRKTANDFISNAYQTR